MRGAIRDARTYELMTIFSPDVAEDEIQATIDAVVGYITDASGEHVEFNRDSPWGRRRLAYAIRHASRDVRDGFYTLYHFEIAPHRVIDIEREIKLNDRIMRYLLTQYTPRPIDESATAQAPSDTAEEPDASAGDDADVSETASEDSAAASAVEEATESVQDATESAQDATESAQDATESVEASESTDAGTDSSEEPSTEEA